MGAIASGISGVIARFPRALDRLHALDLTNEQLITALRDKFQVRLFRFGSALQRIENPASLGFEAVETRVGDAVMAARQELDAVPLSGLVVLSDGADNASQAVADELQTLRARNVPVFTVGVGEERFARDAEIERVELPRQILEGTSFVANVVIRQRGFEGDRVPLVIEDEGRVIAREEIELPPDGAAAPVRVPVTLRDAGARTLRFHIPVQNNEQVTQNNTFEGMFQVGRKWQPYRTASRFVRSHTTRGVRTGRRSAKPLCRPSAPRSRRPPAMAARRWSCRSAPSGRDPKRNTWKGWNTATVQASPRIPASSNGWRR